MTRGLLQAAHPQRPIRLLKRRSSPLPLHAHFPSPTAGGGSELEEEEEEVIVKITKKQHPMKPAEKYQAVASP